MSAQMIEQTEPVGAFDSFTPGTRVRVHAEEAGRSWRGIVIGEFPENVYDVFLGRDTQGQPKIESYEANELTRLGSEPLTEVAALVREELRIRRHAIRGDGLGAAGRSIAHRINSLMSVR